MVAAVINTHTVLIASTSFAHIHHIHTYGPHQQTATTAADIAYILVCKHNIRECGSTLYVGMAQGVSFSLYIGIGAKFENTQKTGERRLRTAEYRTVLL